MRELHVRRAPPQFVIVNAPADADRLQQRAMAATNNKLPPHTGRRKQRATLRLSEPQMIILRSVDPRNIEQWKLALAVFVTQAKQYRNLCNAQYQINIQRWVDEDVWRYISERLLLPHHRTRRGMDPNHKAVAQFLLGRGEYSTEFLLGKIEHSKNTTRETYSRSRPATTPAAPQVQRTITRSLDNGTIALTLNQAPSEPTMRILTSANPTSMRRWQEQLESFLQQARQYQQQHDPNYQVDLQSWVRPDIWNYISENLLCDEHRTAEGSASNDAAVQTYLLRRGRYNTEKRQRTTTRKSQTPASRRWRLTENHSNDSSTEAEGGSTDNSTDNGASYSGERAPPQQPPSVSTSISQISGTSNNEDESDTTKETRATAAEISTSSAAQQYTDSSDSTDTEPRKHL